MRHLVRTGARIGAIAFLSLGLLGMGGFGGGGQTEPPARDFRAVFTDVDGMRMDVTRVSAGGDASIEGELGRGRLKVPFDNIDVITFSPSPNERDRVKAELKLRQGEPVTLSVRSAMTFYGRVPGGGFQIRARDLKSVDFGE
jgi:hypothetical protein